MNFIALVAKVFAVSFLLFVNFIVVIGQSDSIYKLPAGTKIHLRMDSEISSKVSSVNDTFTATVAKPISVGNAVILSAGAVIEGRVIKVSTAGIGRKNGRMQVRFETIRFANSLKREIDGSLVKELKASSTRTADLIAVLGGTSAGAIFGAVSKVENGALIGAGIGAGAGTGVAFLRKGKDVYIRTHEEFEIELKSEVTLPASDY